MGYKGDIIKYLLYRKEVLSLKDLRTTMRATWYGYLLIKVPFILPFSKCLLKYLLRISDADRKT